LHTLVNTISFLDILERMKSVKLIFATFLLLISYISEGQTIDEHKALLKEIDKKISLINIQREALLQQKENFKLALSIASIKDIGLPTGAAQEEIIEHSAMILSYNERHEQANWVFHQILPDIIDGNQSRSNDFRIDSLVSSGTAVQADYFLVDTNQSGQKTYNGFGYDRGHLAPSADFRWSAKALSESYLYSNMSPQDPLFNREKWAELESILRGYVISEKRPLYVITGPVLTENLPSIIKSKNNVSIPELFFKAIYDPVGQITQAFLMPNKYCKLYLRKYAVSVDSVERLTGLNLFPNLKDSTIENQNNGKYWMPKENKSDVEPLPLNKLPKKAFNTETSKALIDDGKQHTVCGTVVSTKKSGKGNVFLNLDKSFPNHVLSQHQGVPSMNISKEESIKVLD